MPASNLYFTTWDVLGRGVTSPGAMVSCGWGGTTTPPPDGAMPMLPEHDLLNEGGTSSGGSFCGTGWPILAISTRCMATQNSSEVSVPSSSMSARSLDRHGNDWLLQTSEHW